MVTFLQSLQTHLLKAMQQDKTVYVLGEDILDPYGGAFKVTKGLSTQFPERVITTPISEAGLVGIANGMALRGLKPVVELMFGDFITLAADQLVNYAAKFSSMYQSENPGALLLRMPVGAGRGYGPTHSQSLEKMFFGIPHLNIIAPSHFHDPGQILKNLILNSTTPTLFLEHKLLYTSPLWAVKNDDPIRVDWSDNPVPTAFVRNYAASQRADLTILAYGGASLWLEPLLRELAAEEIRVQVCLPAAIKPLDMSPLFTAVRENGRLIIVEEGSGHWGWGSEIAALMQQELWGVLKKPVKRIAALNTIVPTAKPLEEAYLPSRQQIEKAIYEVLQ